MKKKIYKVLINIKIPIPRSSNNTTKFNLFEPIVKLLIWVTKYAPNITK